MSYEWKTYAHRPRIDAKTAGGLIGDAFDALRAVATDKGADSMARVEAAKALLEWATPSLPKGKEGE